MAYILMSTVCLLTFGRIADMFGRVRMYNLGFIIFTVGSALCGFRRARRELIIFRLVQGAGAAFMMVNSPAIIAEVFPPQQRGRALGINGMTFAVGGILARSWAGSSSRPRTGAGSSTSTCPSGYWAPSGATSR